MPHQREFVDVFLEVQSEAAGDPEPGEWAFNDATWTIERRGGKTSLITPIVAHRARMIERARIFMTAQNRDKARARWMDATDDVLASVLRDDVRRKVGRSAEELRWRREGSLFVPFAPNEDGLHSETPDLVLIDELWAFDAEQRRQVQAGYVPAFATTGGQALKMSTAGTARSVWLNAVRKAGRAAVEAGTRLGVCYFEHSLPDRVDGRRISSLSDSELVEACIRNHPAVCHAPGCPGPRGRGPCQHGFTVRPSAIRAAWTEMADRLEFLRAYANRSAGDLTERWLALEEQVWRDAEDVEGIPPEAPVAFGVWVDDDGNGAAVAAGWRDPAGVMHVEHLDQLESVREVRPYVTEKAARHAPRAVAIANVGTARDVADELEAAGVETLRIGQADVIAACSRHRTELADGSWVHLPSSAGTSAAAAADWRKTRGGGVWDQLEESIAPLGAQTMAGWGWDHAPAPKIRRPFKIR